MAAQQRQQRERGEEDGVWGRVAKCRLVDLTERGLQHLDTVSLCPADTYTLILDKNQLTKLENVEKCKDLVQLSVASNRLVRMNGVAKLVNLRVLNLPHNSIGNVEGLKDLIHLEWLNLAGNNIKTMDPVNSCILLQHLDLSDNNIPLIGDVSKLTSLKTLLLHGNTITTLRSASSHLASGLSILSLAENEIRDLNEISYLGFLGELEQLSIMNNPCVMATPSLPGFDYRPYIVSWCLTLRILDGYIISQKESLKAEWLYSQGKGRSFRPSQHVQLVQYLASICPLGSTPALQSAEDAKLEKILNKQRLHQLELIEKFQNSGNLLQSGPIRDLSFQSEHNSTTHNYVACNVKEPVIQINSWVGTCGQDDDSYVLNRLSPHAGQTTSCCQSELFLEDIQTDEDKLNCSLLSSESTFMPVASLSSPLSPSRNLGFPDDLLASENDAIEVSYLETQINNEESDDRKHQRVGQRTEEQAIHMGRATEQSIVENGGQIFCVPNALLSDVTLTSSASNYPVSSSLMKSQISLANQGVMENEQKLAGKNDKLDQHGQSELLETNVQALHEMNEAATKIQALWRGFYIRNCHINTKEVRSEIRLRRMQEHIEYLTEEVLRWRKECAEERIQRLVQEEAVKFLWNQVRSLQEWKMSMTEKQTVLDSDINELSPTLAQPISVHHSECQPQAIVLNNHAGSRQGTSLVDSMQEFPDSGFQSSDIANPCLKDSLNSCRSSSEGSNSTVVEASIGTAKTNNEFLTEETEGLDSSHNACSKESSNSEQDNSLIEQYLNSVQQLEAAEDGTDCSVRTETSSRQDDQDSLCEVVSVEVSGETNAKRPSHANSNRTEMYSQAEESIYGMLDSV